MHRQCFQSIRIEILLLAIYERLLWLIYDEDSLRPNLRTKIGSENEKAFVGLERNLNLGSTDFWTST